MNNPISDLHVHCALKGYASEGYPGNEGKTIWDFFNEKKEELEKLNFILRSAIKETAKHSQANLDACVEANLCAPFLAILIAYFFLKERIGWHRFTCRRQSHR